ncbi:uncharacterized protein MONOS_7217 [Monocercomonoides exilis]|uniref:uncharacterized protein n=1 Tax=Monocercomonoides exilis TaxID=2049356 RepID=UPI00355A9D8B|nr:hypothetical protein MONOS_7217 [Monocercomonoides exilis]|eukprot:MONOS_7217.1-p1 / transcript=MONOS_7217.1 / gene=MONOS_7217 / organism=Monocercomonoides_exilis_PA203 / gene_product=unspecified product / transcript_product=unspecified product / location=Mono_scaffold00241:54866-55681(-) / protein_length=271 / sequence_SO=supercontig / SO=protein_coding / is_pseudo=false
MLSTLLEWMTSQIPLLIDNDEEEGTEAGGTSDEARTENDLPDLELRLPVPEEVLVCEVLQSNSLKVISAKKPFGETKKKGLKTLYSVIHSVQGNFTLGTRTMDVDGKEVVLAVAKLFEHLISVGDEMAGLMGRQLCPYTIFIEEGGASGRGIFVLTEELEEEKQKEEMKRWKAPEARVGEEDMEMSVVFTLGLILHEMTIGEVPLSECDAEEAQEMMRDGVRPLTEGIDEEEMVELMEKVFANEQNDRCSVEYVILLAMKMICNDIKSACK